MRSYLFPWARKLRAGKWQGVKIGEFKKEKNIDENKIKKKRNLQFHCKQYQTQLLGKFFVTKQCKLSPTTHYLPQSTLVVVGVFF